jgi:uncharacterized membrane protein
MQTACSILIHAPLERVYAMTSDLARWPAYLPHYRSVTWVTGGPDHGMLEMDALRSCIPISWRSEFQREESVPRLTFSHTSFLTKGMEVRWIYTQENSGVSVTIEHDLDFRWPIFAAVADYLVGEVMIGWVAPRTLATFKKLLEQ